MATHFIADVHLRASGDANARALIDYLADSARSADALYVLGDLFDVWIGDDGSLAHHRPVLAAFAELAARGVPVYFMRGNRDFAVGPAFVAASGMRIVADPLLVELYGTRTLLTHGDMLCSDDLAQQTFRARYTDAAWRARMLRWPLWLRRLVGAYAQRRSAARKYRAAAASMDTRAETVARLMRGYEARRLIHGHTHRPACHRFTLDGATAARHVLADWCGRQAQILTVDRNGVRRRCLTDDHGLYF